MLSYYLLLGILLNVNVSINNSLFKILNEADTSDTDRINKILSFVCIHDKLN